MSIKRRLPAIVVVFLLFRNGDGKSLPKGERRELEQAEKIRSAHHSGDEFTKHHSKIDKNELDTIFKHVEEIPSGEHDSKSKHKELDMSKKKKHGSAAKSYPLSHDLMSRSSHELNSDRYDALKSLDLSMFHHDKDQDRSADSEVEMPLDPIALEFPIVHHAKDRFTALKDEIPMDPKPKEVPALHHAKKHSAVSEIEIPMNSKAHKSPAVHDAKDHSNVLKDEISLDTKPQNVPSFHHAQESSAASKVDIPTDLKAQDFLTFHHAKDRSTPLKSDFSIDPKPQEVPTFYHAQEPSVATKAEIPTDPKAQEFITDHHAKYRSTPLKADFSMDPKPLEFPTSHLAKALYKAPKAETPTTPDAQKIPMMEEAQDLFIGKKSVTQHALHDSTIPEFEKIQEAPKHSMPPKRYIHPFDEVEDIPKLLQEQDRSTDWNAAPKSEDDSIYPRVVKKAEKLWKDGMNVARQIKREADGRLAYLALKKMADNGLGYKVPDVGLSATDIWNEVNTMKKQYAELKDVMGNYAKLFNFNMGDFEKKLN